MLKVRVLVRVQDTVQDRNRNLLNINRKCKMGRMFPLEFRSLATKGTQVIALALRLSKNGSLSGAKVQII